MNSKPSTWSTAMEAHEAWVAQYAPNCPVCGTNPCYRICPESPDFYSPEQEREDTLWQDSLSHDAWFALAVRQYELVHAAYVS